MTQRPTLSLCMIVKDEAANLARCLESVRGLVDDIVIVDTGSQDDTVALAESFDARVLHEPWTDNYSAPRNTSLSAATGDWILVLDADEALSSTDHAAIRTAMAHSAVAGYRMRTRNYVQDADKADAVRNTNPPPEGAGFPAWIPSDKVRLFRNDPRVRFRGVIHELVDQSITDIQGEIAFLDVPVHHYGFLAPEAMRRQKRAMQRRLAEQKLAEHPDDFKAHYEWAVIVHTDGDFAAARDALERSIALRADWAPSHYELGYVCEQLEQWSAAVEAYRRALACDPAHLSAGLNLGILALRTGLIEESERVLRSAITHHPHDPRAWNNLGALLGNQSRHEEAEAAWRETLRLDPANPQARKNLDRLPHERAATEDRPHVSLCMIVRDEAKSLAAAVEPLRSLVDEIIIVDTGSQDDTVAIAESLGARVEHFPWCDDFAAARNAALAHATGDWIVWLDADDRIPESSLPALAKALRATPDRAIQWCVESQSGGREAVRFLQLRQFPRKAGLRWSGRIHEALTPAARAAGLSIENAPDVVIVHTGYRDADMLQRKHERNLRLLKMEYAEKPTDATICHHLAQTYNLLGQPDEGRAMTERILALEPLEGDERYLGLQARVRLAQVAQQNGEHADAIRLLHEALAIVPHYPPAEYLLGEILWQEGDLDAATPHLRNVAHADMPLSELPLPLPALRAGAWNILGRIAQERGRHLDATDCFVQAVAHVSTVAVIHMNHAESLAALGREEDARTAADRASRLAPNDFAIAQRCRDLSSAPVEDSAGSPLLSLCMIVRDEATNLRELLPDVAAVADEIIIVDTGSADDTREVAETCGACVLREPWADDFAAARNVGLAAAQGAWVLWLDADDRVSQEGLAALKRMLPTLSPQAIRVPVCSHVGPNGVTTLSLRVFPRGHNVQWRGRVHEDLVASCVEAGLPIVDCFDLVIQHTGYGDADTLHSKMERNRRLLLLQLEEHADDARSELHLAETERYFSEDAAAETRLDGLLARELPAALRVQVLAHRAAAARDADDVTTWLKMAQEWLQRAPEDAAARLSCAEALTRLGRWEEALPILEAAEEHLARPGSVPVQLDALKVQYRCLLGVCYRHVGRPDDAVRELGAALHMNPAEPAALFELANVHWDAQRLDEADAAYSALLSTHPTHAPALVQRGNIAFQRQQYDAADAFFCDAMTHDPTLRQAQENACVSALALGDRQRARTRLEAALTQYPDADHLRVHLADLDFGEAAYGQALNGYRLYLTAQPADVKALTRLGDCLRLLDHPTEARQAYAAALQLEPSSALAQQGLAALEAVV